VQVLFPTLIAACFGNRRVCDVVAEHVSVQMLLTFLARGGHTPPGLEPRYHLANRFPLDLLPQAQAFFAEVAAQPGSRHGLSVGVGV